MEQEICFCFSICNKFQICYFAGYFNRKKMKRKQIIELIIVFIVGLTPLLWFHGNQVILGHDSGLTLFLISHFTDRLFAWTERFGFGNDQTYAIAGFFIHGLDALISSFGFNL